MEPIVLMRGQLKVLHFDERGRKRAEMTYAGPPKGKVWVFLALGIAEPEKVTPEFITKAIEYYAAQEWHWRDSDKKAMVEKPETKK